MNHWLIDMGYVVKQAPWRLDYIATKYLLDRTYGAVFPHIFNSIDEAYGVSEGLKKFYEFMRRYGAAIHLHPMSHGQQRRVDVDIAAHLMLYAAQGAKIVVLTTGDQDFLPAVRLVRSHYATRVVLASFEGRTNASLVDTVDEVLWLNEYCGQLELRY